MDYSFDWIDAGRPTELSTWDEFVRFTPQGHYCGYSTWLQSFAVYGFDAEVLVAKALADGEIVGGLGIRFGYGPLKVAGGTVGPLVALGHEALVPQLLERLSAWARDAGAAFVQIQLLSPASRDEYEANEAGLLSSSASDGGGRLQAGRLLKAGLPSGYKNLVAQHPEIAGSDGDEAVLATFPQSMRRNIRWAFRNVPAPYSAGDPSQIREGYALIEVNGREYGYATREWKDVESMLCAQVERGQGELICVKVDGAVIASACVLVAGSTMTHAMAGTKRLKPDLSAGAHVHWAAMRRAQGYYPSTLRYISQDLKKREGREALIPSRFAPQLRVKQRLGKGGGSQEGLSKGLACVDFRLAPTKMSAF